MDIDLNIGTGICSTLSAVITGFFTWFYSRRKYNSEVENSVIKNMQDSLDFYKQLSDDNKSRLEVLQEENNELRKQIDTLKSQMMELMAQLCYNKLIPRDINASNGKTDC